MTLEWATATHARYQIYTFEFGVILVTGLASDKTQVWKYMVYKKGSYYRFKLL